MGRRWVRVAVWGTVALSFALFLLGLLLRETPLLDRFAESTLRKALAESGATFTVESRSGTLLSGLELRGVRLTLPSGATAEAKRISLRLQSTPLLVGIFYVKKPRIEGLRVVLPPPPPTPSPAQEGASPGNPLPAWLVVNAADVALDGLLVLPPAEPEPSGRTVAFSGALDLFLAGKQVALQHLEATVRPGEGLPRSVRLSGRLAFRPPGGLSGDLRLEGGGSRLCLTGKAELAGPQSRGEVRYSAKPVVFREIPLLFAGFPDLVLEGRGYAAWKGGEVSWTFDGGERAAGAFRLSARSLASEGGVEVQGSLDTPGLSLSFLWPTPPGRDPLLSGGATFRLSVPWTGNPVQWSLTGRLGPSSVWGLPLDSATARASGDLASFRIEGEGQSPLFGRGPVSVEVAEGGSLVRLELAGEAVDLKALLDRLDLLPALPHPLHLPSTPLSAERVHILWKGEDFHLEARGKDRQGGAYDGTLEAPGGRAPSWEVHVEGVSTDVWGVPGEGRLSFGARFHGRDLDHGVIALSARSQSYLGVEVGPFETEVELDRWERFRITRLEADSSLGRWVVKDLTAGPGGALSFGWTFAAPSLEPLGHRLKLPLEGTLQAEGTLSGSFSEPRLRARFQGRSLRTQAATADVVEGEADLAPQAWRASLSWKGLSTSVATLGDGEGSFRREDGEDHLEIRSQLGEDRRIEAAARGSVGRETGDLRVHRLVVFLKDRPFASDQTARVTWSPTKLSWRDFTLLRNENRLSLFGEVGLSGPSAGRIEGELTAVHFPLRFFALVQDPDRVQGHANGTLRWRGTLERPLLEGALSFSGVRFTLPESDLVLLFEGGLQAAGDRLLFEKVRVTTPEGGAARLDGEMEFKGFFVRRVALRARGEDFPFVLFRDLSGLADFDMALKGPFSAPVLTGKAKILKGRFQLPDVARLAPLPSSLRFVNAPKGSPYAEPDLEQDFLSRIRGTLEVSSDAKFWAVNRSLLAELSGHLTLAFTPDGQTLSGTLQILSGRYLFQGLKFDLADSKIYFKGTTDWTPLLDLTARRQAPGAEVTARVQGFADHPTLTLSSSPPMEQGEILATLLFGRSRNLSAGENAQWGSAAAALAFQYRAGGLLESVQRRLNVDTLSVGADPLGGPQVGFSKYIGDRTVLEYYQTFGALPEGRLNLRYRINRNLSVQSESSTLGRSGMDLLWERRY